MKNMRFYKLFLCTLQTHKGDVILIGVDDNGNAISVDVEEKLLRI